MKYEIIKQAFKLGNSAGVVLPSNWKDKKVSIKLIERSITEEIFEILEEKDLLKNTIGIFLAGSYARGEETEDSDIDVLVVTDNIDRQIKVGKYEIVFISKSKFEKSITKSLYLASLINEAKVILNNYILQYYKNKVKGISTKEYINEIKSITRINKGFVDIDEELEEKVLDETLYSIVLRLRELYLIECLKNNKTPSNKEFIYLINKIANEESYKAYLRIKNDTIPKKVVSVKDARALIDEIKKRIGNMEHGKKKS
ncbi:nucleotidyltransferase domain-containing protein [Candidatus Pacearchaeota archaeon]|nr:nucleotidyltransferase domain-containing protein [Candidatus Pacearchaeota archaeon]